MSEQKALLESIRDLMANADDDVLVLTQKVNSDGSIVSINPARTEPQIFSPPPEPVSFVPPEPASVAPAPEPEINIAINTAPAANNDILGEIDALLSDPTMQNTSAAVPEAEPPAMPEINIADSFDNLFSEPEPPPEPLAELISEETAPQPEILPAIAPEIVFEPIPEPAPETIAEPVMAAPPEPLIVPEPEIIQQINQSETIVELELADIKPELEQTPVLKEEKMENTESLLSEASAGAAKSSIQNLMEKVRIANEPKTDPSAAFRSGETVENLVMEMLRPMVKEWMDNNLPVIVESIVQKEVQKLTSV